MTEAFDLEATRGAVLDAALVHVPFEGWTETALIAGARDAGFDAAMALRVFPGGVNEAIEWMSLRADRRAMAALEARDLSKMRVRDRVTLAVRTRIEMEGPHREAARRTLTILAAPMNAPLGLKLLFRTVDALWYAAGDTATDFNFYTKRALLAGVYAATSLYWLDDRSENSAESWAFLDRRIGEVMQVPKIIGRIGDALGRFPMPFAGLRARARTRP
ncbi:MAG: COQ9 family protein [Rhodospirillaceae bacterium]|nr:COQ9 family protein [Rhodospirillaceae bacterium]